MSNAENLKKPFVRIDFKNCGLDYDYTICPFADVEDYIQSVDSDFSLHETTFNLLIAEDQLPEVKLTVVMMTAAEYSDWFEKNVEANA